METVFAGNSPVIGKFPSQKPVTGSSDVFFGLHLNKRSRRDAGHLRRHCANYDVMPSFSQVVTRIFNCLSIDEEDIALIFKDNGLHLPKLVRPNISWGILFPWWNQAAMFVFNMQGSFCVCAQSMRDDITLWSRLPFAGRIHKMIPAYVMNMSSSISPTFYEVTECYDL